MTSSRQTSFDVFRVAADGSIDEHRMAWPSAAHTKRFMITVPEVSDLVWVASQLRKLALRFENDLPQSITSGNAKHAPVSPAGPEIIKLKAVEREPNEKAGT
jgi:hypothetical protein